MKIISRVILGCTAVCWSMTLSAENLTTEQAIQEQVSSASDCEQLAYETPIDGYDTDRIFQSCVKTRAILIAMTKKYGVGQKGEVDIIDKLDAYSYLANSSNALVKQEAARHLTAAGPKK